MADTKLLLLQGPPGEVDLLPDVFKREFPGVGVEIARYVTQGLEKLKKAKIQAVVCWADLPDELAAVIRIRKADPRIPVLLVSSREEDEDFRKLALQMGASSVLPDPADPEELGAILREAIRTTDLARETLKNAKKALGLSKDVENLARESRKLAEDARRSLRASGGIRFAPLLGASDDEAGLLERALAKAELAYLQPILRRGEQVIAYLDGQKPFDDRKKHALPSLLILERGLQGLSMLEVLKWVRQDVRFRTLPVAILGTSAKEREAALEGCATWFLPRGSTMNDLVEAAKKISLNWTLYHLGLEL